MKLSDIRIVNPSPKAVKWQLFAIIQHNGQYSFGAHGLTSLSIHFKIRHHLHALKFDNENF